MELNGIEKRVLEELAVRLVMKKSEIVEFLKDKVENPFSTVEYVTKSLLTQGLITYVRVIGESCIAITQKGIRLAGR